MFLGCLVALAMCAPITAAPRPDAAPAPDAAPTSFPETVRALRKAVFLVGYPDSPASPGNHGTAWCISKQHRLLATNAHVADIQNEAKKANQTCWVMMNGTTTRWEITRIWYHPGVRRFPTPDRNLSVRSVNPGDGSVNPGSPDLAILQLSSDGPDLPAEFRLAPRDVLQDLQSIPVAIFGYPSHDTTTFPSTGAVQATFHEGVISRVTDFNLQAIDDERAQFLQYTMQTIGGFSGSPIFLKNGQLVGIHNSGRTAKNGVPIANGIRADSLWELVKYHGLEDKVPLPSPPPEAMVKRWTLPDPGWDLYRRLTKIKAEADDLIYNHDNFAAGIEKCNEGIAIFKNYAPLYRTRCYGYNNWEFAHGGRYTFEKRRDLLLKAYNDGDTYAKLHRNLTPDALQVKITVLNNLGYLTKNEKFNQEAYDDCQKILSLKNITTFERGAATSSMAVALSNLGNTDAARQKHEQATQIDPDNGSIWSTRASFFENNDNPTAARADRAIAAALQKRERLLYHSNHKDKKIVSKVEEKLTVNDPVDNRNCYYHSWETELEAGYYYQIDLKSPSFKSNKDYDPILRLYDEKGNFVAEDDDGGGYPHSRMFFTAPRTGTFKFIVTSYVQRQTGPYVLTVQRIAADR
jgi:tetratricopeptide (TPR) repeat protein